MCCSAFSSWTASNRGHDVSNEINVKDDFTRRLLTVTDAQIQELTELLIDCVDGGASVSFMSPLTDAKASAFWRRVADAVSTGERALIVAQDDVGIAGTVQLIL